MKRKKSRERVEMARDVGKRRRKENRQRVMEERKCFVCGGFRHITCHCRNIREKGPAQMPSNRFEVLKDRIMH